MLLSDFTRIWRPDIGQDSGVFTYVLSVSMITSGSRTDIFHYRFSKSSNSQPQTSSSDHTSSSSSRRVSNSHFPTVTPRAQRSSSPPTDQAHSHEYCVEEAAVWVNGVKRGMVWYA